MKEASEIQKALRVVAPVLTGRTIENVEVLRKNMIKNHPTFAKHLRGKRVIAMRQQSKYLWLELSDGLNLMLHLSNNGTLDIQEMKDAPKSRERIRFTIGHDLVLMFNDPRKSNKLWIMDGNDTHKHTHQKTPGVNELTLTEEIFLQRLRTKKGVLKSVLMNQSFIRGVGNIYGDEACFISKIDPRRKVAGLTDPERKLLYKAVVKTLEKGIRPMGTSFLDFTDLFGKPGKNQIALMVYGRKNEKCRACQTRLKSMKIARNTTVWCPTCQR